MAVERISLSRKQGDRCRLDHLNSNHLESTARGQVARGELHGFCVTGQTFYMRYDISCTAATVLTVRRHHFF
jgi:hypothetical protein